MVEKPMGMEGERPEGIKLERYGWYEANTFHYKRFRRLQELLSVKEMTGKRISVCLPSRNEAETIGRILETVRTEMMEKIPLVDQLCVIDGGSEDGTREIAVEMGAEVFLQDEILPGTYSPRGKGDALWRSLYCLGGDIIIWMDSDIRNFHPRFVYGLIGPILVRPEVQFVKGFYQRPLSGGRRVLRTGGGRVTELAARPLLSLFYPELCAVIQPLSGEYGGERQLLESIPFFSGYGVEIGMLIDIYTRYGMDVLGQVDLVSRVHRNQPLPALGRMSFQVIQTVLSLLEKEGRMKLKKRFCDEMTQIDFVDGEYLMEKADLAVEERPPMVEVAAYRDRFGVGA